MTLMARDWLRKPQVLPSKKKNFFERFDLSQNPFPNRSTLVVDSDDWPYLPDLHAQEEKQFENLMIPGPDRATTRTIAFLTPKTQRGRGLGITAFLNHQRERIMKDLGNSLTNGDYVLFATYVFPSFDRTRKFWQFARLISWALCEQNIIAMAMWRLRAFTNLIPNKVLNQAGGNPEETVGNDIWLRKKGVDVDLRLTRTVKSMLERAGIRMEIAEKLALYGHSSSAWQENFLVHQTEFRWRQEGTQLVFDDLARLFFLAGFSKGLLLIDGVERIVTAQNIRERRAFVDSIRRHFIDGPFENTRRDFYSLLLTIHPYIQELLAPHWEAAGLDRFATPSQELAQEYTVYLNSLGQELAVPLVQVYLDESRSSKDQKGSLAPFDEAAVTEIWARSDGVPGKMLTLLYHVMEKASKEQWTSISAEQINQVFQTRSPEEPEDTKANIKQVPAAHPDLKGAG